MPSFDREQLSLRHVVAVSIHHWVKAVQTASRLQTVTAYPTFAAAEPIDGSTGEVPLTPDVRPEINLNGRAARPELRVLLRGLNGMCLHPQSRRKLHTLFSTKSSYDRYPCTLFIRRLVCDTHGGIPETYMASTLYLVYTLVANSKG